MGLECQYNTVLFMGSGIQETIISFTALPEFIPCLSFFLARIFAYFFLWYLLFLICLESAILFIISSRDVHQGFRTIFSYIAFFQRFFFSNLLLLVRISCTVFLSLFSRDLFLLLCGWVPILCSHSSSLSSWGWTLVISKKT